MKIIFQCASPKFFAMKQGHTSIYLVRRMALTMEGDQMTELIQRLCLSRWAVNRRRMAGTKAPKGRSGRLVMLILCIVGMAVQRFNLSASHQAGNQRAARLQQLERFAQSVQSAITGA